MVDIVAGKYVTDELTSRAMGGTEMVAQRMIKYLPNELLKNFQIIHSRIRTLEPGLKKILVCHDLAEDPEVAKLRDPEYRKNFDKIVFVSNWQAQMYNLRLGIPYSEFVVIPNMIEAFPTNINKPGDGVVRFIYHTTPHRGLTLLVPAFELLAERFPDRVHLDVYSSFQIYGWEQRDRHYQAVYERIKNHPNMTYHGYQPNEVVRKALEKADVFAYPCIWQETFCLAAVEAGAAGCILIHPNYAALPEVTKGMWVMYQWDENPSRHVQEFYRQLHGVTQQYLTGKFSSRSVAQLTSSVYNASYKWETVVPLWTELLRMISDGKNSDEDG